MKFPACNITVLSMKPNATMGTAQVTKCFRNSPFSISAELAVGSLTLLERLLEWLMCTWWKCELHRGRQRTNRRDERAAFTVNMAAKTCYCT
mmetsp:Transcript_839/g.1769  ORF Transcript_839/g.1769 Transcript_839/m.1769 type:complete len:92 (+) Transcript_839:989-1264(+)